MRASVDEKSFYRVNVNEFEKRAITILTQVYIFGQLKSARVLPASVLSQYINPTPEGLLIELESSMEKLTRAMYSEQIHYYREADIAALKMVFVMTQTISEFTPYLNLQDKRLKKILVSGLIGITDMHFTSYSDKLRTRESKPYLNSAELGIQQMSKTLTPPNIFQKAFSALKRGEGPQDPYQNEIGPTCSRIFQ